MVLSVDVRMGMVFNGLSKGALKYHLLGFGLVHAVVGVQEVCCELHVVDGRPSRDRPAGHAHGHWGGFRCIEGQRPRQGQEQCRGRVPELRQGRALRQRMSSCAQVWRRLMDIWRWPGKASKAGVKGSTGGSGEQGIKCHNCGGSWHVKAQCPSRAINVFEEGSWEDGDWQ